MTTLCFDFGNTRQKAAVFDSGNFVEEIILSDVGIGNIAALLEKYQPARTILSSVIDHNEEIEVLLASKSAFHKLTHDTKLNFTTAAAKPETIGADRLALVAAAVHYYGDANNLIIAMGSCITYNFVNQYSHFLGGSISPGMDMRFRAMHAFTAKLPLADPGELIAGWNFPLIAYDTKTNLQTGVILGISSEIDGIIDRYRSKYGNFNVVLTGGNSAYFASQLKNKIFADSNFLFKGLYALSELNNCRD